MTFSGIDARFNILTVCAGNLCRSPIAERILRARLLSRVVDVASAGLVANEGQTMPPEAQRVLSDLGVEFDPPHHARRISREFVVQADLILVMTRDQRSEIARMDPRAHRRTFTLREFARLAVGPSESGAAPSSSHWLADAIDETANRRGSVPLRHPEDDDIADPYGKSRAVYRRAGLQIDEAVTTIAAIWNAELRPPGRGVGEMSTSSIQ